MEKLRSIKWFFVALFVPVAVLLSMLVQPLAAQFFGEEIRLLTVPLDPRDLFYGDYVELSLAIETVDVRLLDDALFERVKDADFWKETPVYVSLERNANHIYEVKYVSEKKPDGLFIKGELYPYIFEEQILEEESISRQYVRIDYGLNRFYVEEGKGLELEKLSQRGEIAVTAKVFNGYAVLTDISEWRR